MASRLGSLLLEDTHGCIRQLLPVPKEHPRTAISLARCHSPCRRLSLVAAPPRQTPLTTQLGTGVNALSATSPTNVWASLDGQLGGQTDRLTKHGWYAYSFAIGSDDILMAPVVTTGPKSTWALDEDFTTGTAYRLPLQWIEVAPPGPAGRPRCQQHGGLCERFVRPQHLGADVRRQQAGVAAVQRLEMAGDPVPTQSRPGRNDSRGSADPGALPEERLGNGKYRRRRPGLVRSSCCTGMALGGARSPASCQRIRWQDRSQLTGTAASGCRR